MRNLLPAVFFITGFMPDAFAQLEPVAPAGSSIGKFVVTGHDSNWVLSAYYPGGDIIMFRAHAKDSLGMKMHGSYEIYHIDGQPAVKGQLIDGKQTGTWVRWTTTGAPVDSVLYDAGSKQAIYVFFYKDLVPHPQFVADKKHSTNEYWGYYPNGKLCRYVRTKGDSVLKDVSYLPSGKTTNYKKAYRVFSSMARKKPKGWQTGDPEYYARNWWENDYDYDQKDFDGVPAWDIPRRRAIEEENRRALVRPTVDQ
jgi:hypothetical protein